VSGIFSKQENNMGGLLSSVSEALAATVAAAETGVVRVEGRRRLGASGIVWSTDGVIVTSSHAVERDADLHVGLPDGKTVPARLIGRDNAVDLAVLRAEANGLPPAAWAEPDEQAVGGLVLALGRPGDKILATLGIVSALDEAWTTPAGGAIDHYLQTDAAMYPGFSGGPLVDAEARVLGLNSSALVSGLSLSVPAPTVRRVVEALLAGKAVRRGYLGITAQPVPLPQALAERLGQESGLLLTHVERKSPAEKSQLIQGDMLVTLNGQPVRSLIELQAVLGGDHTGARVPAKLVRAGAVRELAVTIGERSSP
jgi:S1-C subfamily serine protease